MSAGFDYGDGGAFPEVHRSQFPLDMGRPDKKSNALAVTTDSRGTIQNTALARHGVRDGKTVYSKYSDLVPKEYNEQDLQRPCETELEDKVEAARKALMAKIAAKTAGNRPGQGPAAGGDSQYFQYNASETAGGLHRVQNRMVKMVSAQKDPLEPAKFKAKRAPAGPPSPPAPILHSPSRKVTQEDQVNWKVPACISASKNPKSYIIPLDKRLAAEGASAPEVHNSERVAELSKSLEAAARIEQRKIEEKRQLAKKIEMSSKKRQDEELKEMALRVREEKARLEEERPATREEQEEERLRDEMREDRRRTFNYAYRKQQHKNARTGIEVDPDDEREVGERLALGLSASAGGAKSADTFYDQRLFNQDGGRAADLDDPDGEAGAYTKSLLSSHDKKYTQYRAKREDLDAEHRQQAGGPGGGDRTIEFETTKAADLFGMDEILDDVKKDLKQPGRGEKV